MKCQCCVTSRGLSNGVRTAQRDEHAALSPGTPDPEMRQSKKGQQQDFCMKAHIGVDADSSLVHTVPRHGRQRRGRGGGQKPC